MLAPSDGQRCQRSYWFRAATSLFALVVLCQCALPGCKRSQEPSKAASKTIGVTLLTVQHQFYQDLRAGLEEEAEKHGYRLLISSAEFDPARQANQIDEFIV